MNKKEQITSIPQQVKNKFKTGYIQLSVLLKEHNLAK